MADLTQEEWNKGLKKNSDSFLLDVRTPSEYQENKIPGAINIDIYLGSQFAEEIQKLDKDKEYYIYCRSGSRSGQACRYMESIGFKHAYNLLGGILNWKGELE